MARAAHDRWGIRKIVFVFSDDFLKKVYTFPWFHAPEWRQVTIITGSRTIRKSVRGPLNDRGC